MISFTYSFMHARTCSPTAMRPFCPSFVFPCFSFLFLPPYHWTFPAVFQHFSPSFNPSLYICPSSSSCSNLFLSALGNYATIRPQFGNKLHFANQIFQANELSVRYTQIPSNFCPLFSTSSKYSARHTPLASIRVTKNRSFDFLFQRLWDRLWDSKVVFRLRGRNVTNVPNIFLFYATVYWSFKSTIISCFFLSCLIPLFEGKRWLFETTKSSMDCSIRL